MKNLKVNLGKMEIRFSRIYIVIHLFAVFVLFASPFIFFNAFADDTQNIWKITIPDGATEKEKFQGFVPNELPVFVGDTIVWENKDSVIHSITSGIPKFLDQSGMFFDLGEIKPGSSRSHVLTNSDFVAFYYFCEIHPWMTGKIFISDEENAQPETGTPIFLEKQNYVLGEKISISGQVHKDFAGTKYTTLIYNQNDDLVYISNGSFDNDASYLQIIETGGITWNMEGDYQAKLVYSIPSKVAETSFEFSTKLIENESTYVIPEWVKNVGDYWCNDNIEDSEFVNAIQYLIKQDVIELKIEKSDAIFSNEVPEWVKNNACWWSEDKIPDIDFILGLEYLVNIGTIRV
jgi:plastocyanin